MNIILHVNIKYSFNIKYIHVNIIYNTIFIYMCNKYYYSSINNINIINIKIIYVAAILVASKHIQRIASYG